MKKIIGVFIVLLLTLTLAACGGGSENEPTKLVIGASNVPHSEILEAAEPILLEAGIEIDIVRFQDFIIPNKSLATKELDANYFQHIPYLTRQNEEHGYGFVNAGGIHIEPIGVYSQKHKSLEELPEGADILMSSSVADHGRILSMLEEKGLIRLAEGVGFNATLEDIVENPKSFTFDARIDASLLAQAYLNGEGDASLINSNYALGAGLSPGKDAIALESGDETNPFVNIVAVRGGDETRPEIKTLIEVLQSEEIRSFILDKWGGDIVPVK